MKSRIQRILLGISIGLLTDLVCSFLFSLALGLILLLALSFQGYEGEDLIAALGDNALNFPWIAISVLGGTIISIFAGFISANIIQYEYTNYLGMEGVLLAVISFSGSSTVLSQSTSVFFAFLTLIAVVGGGWLYDWILE